MRAVDASAAGHLQSGHKLLRLDVDSTTSLFKSFPHKKLVVIIRSQQSLGRGVQFFYASHERQTGPTLKVLTDNQQAWVMALCQLLPLAFNRNCTYQAVVNWWNADE